MPMRFWMLGATGTLDSVGSLLAHALDVNLQLHDSSYRGGDHLRGRGPTLHEVIVQRNFRDEDGQLAEESYPEFTVLVYATQNLNDPRLDEQTLEGLKVLNVQEL